MAHKTWPKGERFSRLYADVNR